MSNQSLHAPRRTRPGAPHRPASAGTPTAAPATVDVRALARLAELLPAMVVTGAGISAGAGIPTYRDERGNWLRSEPIKHQEFVAEHRKRQRYWGRSILGWPAVRDARPGSAHRSLAALERRGLLTRLVTQNVDRLHQRAGSQHVIDLHGRLDRVLCLSCGHDCCRELLQQELQSLNPHIHAAAVSARPDGDADLDDALVDSVRVPDCPQCKGVLMPDVVFFGGSIPAARVERCREALHDARSLLVIGSSLQVYSGFRFCRWARDSGKPLFIVNPGVTRADALADEKLDAGAEPVLEALVSLTGSRERDGQAVAGR